MNTMPSFISITIDKSTISQFYADTIAMYVYITSGFQTVANTPTAKVFSGMLVVHMFSETESTGRVLAICLSEKPRNTHPCFCLTQQH